MKESTLTALVFSLLALAGAISLTIVVPSHTSFAAPACADRVAGGAACR